jgi:hypothetical protein
LPPACLSNECSFRSMSSGKCEVISTYKLWGKPIYRGEGQGSRELAFCTS